MRRRSLAFLSTAAVAAISLAGCASAEEPQEQAGTEQPADSACDVPAVEAQTLSYEPLSSASMEADELFADVEVTGDVGEVPDIAFDAPLDVGEVDAPFTLDDVHHEILVEGDGDRVEAGDLIDFAAVTYDPESGEEVFTEGYDDDVIAFTITSGDLFGAVLGDAKVGTRAIMAIPAQTSGEGYTQPARMIVVDLLGTTPNSAWGDEQALPDGFPEVTVNADGSPDVTVVEDADEPETTEIAAMRVGDGDTVQDGDTVLVQYRGVCARTGNEFDSSWSRGGEPTSFATNAVIEGFTKALVDQTVGSQVVAVIPPAEGYGVAESANGLGGETLIFVVDILDTMRAPQA